MSDYHAIANMETEVSSITAGVYTGFRKLFRQGMRHPTQQQLIEVCTPLCVTAFRPDVVLSRLPLESLFVRYAKDRDSSRIRLLELTVLASIEWLNVREHLLRKNVYAKQLYNRLMRMRLFYPMTETCNGRLSPTVLPTIIMRCLNLKATVPTVEYSETLQQRVKLCNALVLATS